MKVLLGGGANARAGSRLGTALHVAALGGRAKAAALLLRDSPKNDDGNTKDLADAINAAGWTALHVASRQGNAKAARALLKHGASVDARDRRYGGVAGPDEPDG